MTKNNRIVADEATGNVMIKAERGLDPFLARRIRDRVMSFDCTATIHNGHGVFADACSVLQLLLLGAPEGELVVLRCVGPQAHQAYATLACVLEARGGVS